MTQNINGEATSKTLGKIKKFSVEINVEINNDNNRKNYSLFVPFIFAVYQKINENLHKKSHILKLK
jgi:hypothetical protein